MPKTLDSMHGKNLLSCHTGQTDLIHRLRVAAARAVSLRNLYSRRESRSLMTQGLPVSSAKYSRNGHAALCRARPRICGSSHPGTRESDRPDHGREQCCCRRPRSFGIGDPAGKMLRLRSRGRRTRHQNSVFACRFSFLPGVRRRTLVKVRHQLLGRGSLAGIVAGGLMPPGEAPPSRQSRRRRRKPAVNGDGYASVLSNTASVSTTPSAA